MAEIRDLDADAADNDVKEVIKFLVDLLAEHGVNAMAEIRDLDADAADNDVKEVIKFLVDLLAEHGVNARVTPTYQDLLLVRLVTSLIIIAANYYQLAKTAIQKDKPENPAYYYERQVLNRLLGHAQLLSWISQARSPDFVKRWPLIQEIIDAISTRFQPVPILIPIISPQFEYNHLNYMENVGVIMIPLNIWSVPKRKLGVLWHEVAGYAIARARHNGDLEKCAIKLHKRLEENGLVDYYKDRFRQSAVEQVTVKLRLNKIYATVNEATKARESFEAKVAENDWQMRYLGEFVEDIFIAQAFEERAPEMLELALRQYYERPDLGDITHPPPELRLQVVKEYLNLRDPDQSDKIENNAGELKRTARIIAQLVGEDIEKFSKKDEDLKNSKEKSVVGLINGILDGGLSLDQAQKELEDQTQKELDPPEKDSSEEMPVASKYIWLSAGFQDRDLKEVRDDAGEIIAYICKEDTDTDRKEDTDIKLKALEKIDKIMFVDRDQTGDPSSGTLALL